MIKPKTTTELPANLDLKVQEVFNLMDIDGDKFVDRVEFMQFFQQAGNVGTQA